MQKISTESKTGFSAATDLLTAWLLECGVPKKCREAGQSEAKMLVKTQKTWQCWRSLGWKWKWTRNWIWGHPCHSVANNLIASCPCQGLCAAEMQNNGRRIYLMAEAAQEQGNGVRQQDCAVRRRSQCDGGEIHKECSPEAGKNAH